MSDSEEPLTDLDKFIKELEQQRTDKILKDLDDLVPPESQWKAAPPARKAKPKPMVVTWVKRDQDGNRIYARPRSSRRKPNEAGLRPNATVSSQKTVPPVNASHPLPDINLPLEQFIQELEDSLNLAIASSGAKEAPPPPPPKASNDWSTRKRQAEEKRQAAKPRLVNSVVAKENVGSHTCQECAINPAAVRCHDCQPRPFFCAQCDVIKHTSQVLHNRDAMTAGFFQPLPPTTCIVDKVPCHCERIVPLRMPDNICSCPKESLTLKPGEAVAVVTMEGRYDLSMPELSCEACKATWTAGVDEPIPRNYWPAIHFATLYATDIFLSFVQMKMATPPLSCHAFVRMLNQRTVHFGRTGKISTDCFQESFLEWEALQSELGNIGKKKKKKAAHS